MTTPLTVRPFSEVESSGLEIQAAVRLLRALRRLRARLGGGADESVGQMVPHLGGAAASVEALADRVRTEPGLTSDQIRWQIHGYFQELERGLWE